MPANTHIKNCAPVRLAALLTLCVPLSTWAVPEALPPMHADIARSTVSGVSSGAFMASQFHVAFSSTVQGAGIIAGGPYYCAGHSTMQAFSVTAMTTCMQPDGAGPNAARLLQRARSFARAGLIDDLGNLKQHRLYLFSGTADGVVTRTVVDQTAAFYQRAGMPKSNIRYVHNVKAGHAILTDRATDLDCAATAAPFINNCRFNQAHDILAHLYPGLQPAADRVGGRLLRFSQAEFAPTKKTGLGEIGYAYVPPSCQRERCAVHIVFHGCAQGQDVIGDRFATSTGYNELADTNRLIVLYPQVRTSKAYPYNPRGCWDFWGYASLNPYQPDFHTKQAPQMAAVKAMLDRLAEPRKHP